MSTRDVLVSSLAWSDAGPREAVGMVRPVGGRPSAVLVLSGVVRGDETAAVSFLAWSGAGRRGVVEKAGLVGGRPSAVLVLS
ncbi:hypothetical protein, partial [Streptomyces sp. NRRL WC-3774]|uniref:hypothetical protein n=1 Tax=Streptomyces sp. NRRL WC-3774 TaxID=1463937 RepID=UPI001F3408C6